MLHYVILFNTMKFYSYFRIEFTGFYHPIFIFINTNFSIDALPPNINIVRKYNKNYYINQTIYK